jgi:hypothetical protein
MLGPCVGQGDERHTCAAHTRRLANESPQGAQVSPPRMASILLTWVLGMRRGAGVRALQAARWTGARRQDKRQRSLGRCDLVQVRR